MSSTTGIPQPAPPPGAAPVTDGRRFSVRAALALVAVLIGGMSFLLLWLLVQQAWAPLAALDGEVAARLNASVSGSPLLVDVLRTLTDLGGTGTAVLVLTLATAFLAIRGAWRLAAFVTVTGTGLAVLVPATKAVIDRARPVVDSPVVEVPGNASFPSGHAMTSLVTWGVLLLLALPAVHRRLRPWLITGTVVLVIAVGFTRLALGVHFVSDVLAGWALGGAWLVAMTAAFRGWQHDRGRAGGDPLDLLDLAPEETPRPAPRGQALPGGRTALLRLGAVAAVLLLGLCALGLLVTRTLTDTWVGRADRALVRSVVEHRTGTLTDVATVVSASAGTRTVVAVGLALAVLGVAVTATWRPAVFVTAALLGQMVLYIVTAQVVGRSRPDVADLTEGLPGGASWPSGHVAAAAAVYGATAVLVVTHGRSRRRWFALVLPLLVVPAVAVSRVYVAAHHPTDVLAGLLLGTVWVVACRALLLTPGRREPSAAPDPEEGT